MQTVKRPRQRRAQVNTKASGMEAAQLEVKIFDALAHYPIRSIGQLANLIGLDVQDIQGRVGWLQRNGWIINTKPGHIWEIGRGKDLDD